MKATNFNLIRPVGKLFPFCAMICESIRVRLLHASSQAIGRLCGNDLIVNRFAFATLLIVHDAVCHFLFAHVAVLAIFIQ